MALLAYVPAMQAGFIWDDESYVTQNAAVQATDGLGRIWFDVTATPQYYPLVYSTFWLEHRLWGLHPTGYHVVNILLHGIAAVLLWRLLRRLAVRGAWLAAAIFAVHPVCVESVAWVTERKNVLSAVFYLSSALAYVVFCDAAGGGGRKERRWGFYMLSVALFISALLSKTVTCTLPAAILLVLWWKRDRLAWRDIWPLLPMFAVGAGMGLMTAWLEKSHVGASGGEWSLTLAQRCLLAGRVPWFYFSKVILPVNLCFIYGHWEIQVRQWWQYVFPAAVVAVVVVLWLLRRRVGKGPLVGVLFFLVTIAPAMGFFNIYMMRYTYVADHFQYHAVMGLAAVLGAVLATVGTTPAPLSGKSGVQASTGSKKNLGQLVAAAGLVLLLGTLTWRRCHVYRDVRALWEDVLAKNPASLVAWDGLGAFYLERGELAKAESCYLESIRVRPDLPDQYMNLANVLVEMHRYDEAIRRYEEALRVRPDYAPAMTGLGVLLSGLGRHDDAIRFLSKVRELRPNDAIAHFNLGMAYRGQGNAAEAVRLLSAGLAIKPDAKAHVQLATILAEKGDLEGAASHCHKALSLDQSSADAHRILADIRIRQGRVADATAELRLALKLRPDWPVVMNNLAWILATHPSPDVRNGPEAVRLAERVIQLTGRGDASTLDTLAAAYADVGRFEEAVGAIQRALSLVDRTRHAPLAEALEERLGLYRSGTSYRQPE